jgi:hypothetical protein
LVENNKVYAYGNNPSATPRLEVYEVGSWTRTTSYDTSCNESTYTLGYKLSSDGSNIYVACPWAGVMVFSEDQAYPSNVYVDFGLEGSDYTYSGELNQTISPKRMDPAQELRSLIPTCDCAGCYFDIGNNACEINISVNSSTQGSIELDNLMLQYDSAPTQNDPKLNSSSVYNRTTDNLTCYNQSTSDYEGDTVTNIYSWYRNDSPLMYIYMPFDTFVNTTTAGAAKDYSGYSSSGYGGTLGGGTAAYVPTWTSAGRVGGAYVFDGLNDYIEVQDWLSSLTDFTFESWVYWNGPTSSVWQRIFDFGNGTIAADHGGYMDLSPRSSSGNVSFEITTGGWNNKQIIQGSNRLPSNTWVHVAVTLSGSTGTIYVNGVANVSGTITLEPTNMNATNNFIGQNSKDIVEASQMFNGTIDEVKLYSYALSAAQIRQDYLETKDGFSNNATIVAEETDKGDIWVCNVTPSDGWLDGTEQKSSQLSITSAAPSVGTVTVSPSPINLNACGNMSVYCSATVTDPDGAGDISSANGELYDDDSVDTGCTTNPNNCFINGGCAITGCAGTTCTANCTFTPVRHYANASANWKCNLTVNDTGSLQSSGTATVTVNNLTAIDAGNTINFGSVTPGTYSSNTSENIINCGNMLLDTMINGSDMTCGFGTIKVGNLSYSASQASGYVNLTSTLNTLDFNLIKATSDAGSNKNSWWRLFVPTIVAGSCIGNVTLVSIYGG